MGGDAGRTGAVRTLRRSLLTGAIVFVLYLVFRLGLFPLVPGLDGLLAVALAAGAAGAVGAWLVRLWVGS